MLKRLVRLTIVGIAFVAAGCASSQTEIQPQESYSQKEIDSACGYPVKFPVSDECLKRAISPDDLRRESNLRVAAWAACDTFTLNGRELRSPCSDVFDQSPSCILSINEKTDEPRFKLDERRCEDAQRADPFCRPIQKLRDEQFQKADACFDALMKQEPPTNEVAKRELDSCLPMPDSPQAKRDCQHAIDDLNEFYTEQRNRAEFLRQAFFRNRPIQSPTTSPVVVIQQGNAPSVQAPAPTPFHPPVFTTCTKAGVTTNCITH